MTLLSTQGLSKQYSGLQAVSDVDFALDAGEIRALIGPNGAGKSTFVGMLCGRIASSSGAVIFDGKDVTRLAAHKRIERGMAYTFQITSIFSKLTVMENVSLAVRRLADSNKRLTRDRVARALERVNLLDKASSVAGDLSYGHQRLLEIAMGIGQEPRLFILDEPTQGLAESEIDAFKSLIQSMVGESTILLIEHNMDVVMETAERITVLNFGEILAEGTPEQIRANKDVQDAYLGAD